MIRRTTISIAIRRAVLVALAPACGQTTTQTTDAGDDVTLPDAAVDVATADVDDGGAIDDSSPFIPDVHPPPGCIISGKPDGFAPCGYVEMLNDSTICQVDVDADGGTQDPSVCYQLCSFDEPDCTYYALDDASYLSCGAGCIGRLHDDARAEERGSCAPLCASAGDWLSDAARLEATAVAAFEIVARDLARFGAPEPLVARALRAADDERRHAKVVGMLARDRGGALRSPVAAAPRARDLRAFALENAVEGCVRETYGAALAAWQASRAKDASVRDAMRAIARDEADHAELGGRIDAWLAHTLDPKTRDEVHAAREAALNALEASLASTTPRAFDDELGLPDKNRALALFQALRDEVWSVRNEA
jgi:hypothetical protein